MSHTHDHQHTHHKSSDWKPHTDWRVLGAILMLIAIGVYVLTLDEGLQPRPDNPPPAANPQ
jgi:hypothetical protein